MPDSRFELSYGTCSRTFTIPCDKIGGPLIRPREPEPRSGAVPEILRRALSAPVGRPRLAELARGRIVGIVISDEFRAGLQHEILDALLDEVTSGSPQSITVLCATGTHDPAVYAKDAGAWVEAARRRLNLQIDFEPHDCEKSDLADIGVTGRGTRLLVNRKLLECDVRIYGHESKHHYFHGYSCIDKQLLPGLSSAETVTQNHKWALDPDSGPGRSPWQVDASRQKNPVCEDTREARALSEHFVISPSGKAVRGDVITFGLDMVSAGGKIFWVRAGDPAELSSKMVGVVDDMMAFEVERAKYVIISPGGPPASQALYGTQNAFDLALKSAIKPGGEALVLAPLDGRPDLDADVRGLAPGRRAKELFWDNLVRLRKKPLAEARREIADNFELYLWKTDRVLRILDQVKIYLHSELPAAVLGPGGFETAPDIQAWIDERVRRSDGKFTVIDHGNKLCVTSRD
ncbi:MAG TPA: lactate racemase domain-containing protein [Myxococcota bacterium]|nr:lactate racemase domain-containing protein [Myxococcota bacterium]